MLVRATESVLHNVFGIAIVADDGNGHAVQLPAVPTNDHLEQLGFSAKHAGEDLFVSAAVEDGDRAGRELFDGSLTSASITFENIRAQAEGYGTSRRELSQRCHEIAKSWWHLGRTGRPFMTVGLSVVAGEAAVAAQVLGALCFLVVAGTDPSGVAFNSAGTFVFVANSGSNTVSAFSVGTGGALTVVAGSPFGTNTGQVDLAVDPSDKFLYVANNGTSSVAMFSISSGVLAGIGTITTGSGPESIAVVGHP